MRINMIKDLKLACHLIKFGLAFKMELFFGILFAVIGIITEFFSKGATFVGGFYIVLSVFMIFQLILSLDLSTLLQSSGYKRKIQLTFPYLVVVPLMLIAFTIVVILHVSFIYTGVDGYSADDNLLMQTQYLLLLGFTLFLTQIYFGLCYKYFLLSTIALVVTIMPAILVINVFSFMTDICSSLPLTILLSYILVLAGSALSYLLSACLYRKNLSKSVFQSALKRAMR